MTKKVKSKILGGGIVVLSLGLVGGLIAGLSKAFEKPEMTKSTDEVTVHEDHSPKIYGVEGEINQESLLTRTDDAVDMTYTIHTTEGLIDSDFDSADIYKNIREYTDARGNVFVSIPKHYPDGSRRP